MNKMRPIATQGVAWSVCWCVSLMVTFASPAKTKPIEMPFLGLTHVGSRNNRWPHSLVIRALDSRLDGRNSISGLRAVGQQP